METALIRLQHTIRKLVFKENDGSLGLLITPSVLIFTGDDMESHVGPFLVER